jgi:hypothetical protein
MLAGLADEPGYKNDEQFDDSLRSVLFQIPGQGQAVVDLGAIDIQRSRDAGIPTYNQLRQALGLPPRTSFTQVTGERTDQLPVGQTIDSPSILSFTSLRDLSGRPVADPDVTRAVYGIRATTLAARLKAIYGSVDNLDAFVGAVAEAHVRGTEFGELQLAMMRRQFQALRDGDRFFYQADPALDWIARHFGISCRHTLAQLIALNSDVSPWSIPTNAFVAPPPYRATPLAG